jgi:hypothetical protein
MEASSQFSYSVSVIPIFVSHLLDILLVLIFSLSEATDHFLCIIDS